MPNLLIFALGAALAGPAWIALCAYVWTRPRGQRIAASLIGRIAGLGYLLRDAREPLDISPPVVDDGPEPPIRRELAATAYVVPEDVPPAECEYVVTAATEIAIRRDSGAHAALEVVTLVDGLDPAEVEQNFRKIHELVCGDADPLDEPAAHGAHEAPVDEPAPSVPAELSANPLFDPLLAITEKSVLFGGAPVEALAARTGFEEPTGAWRMLRPDSEVAAAAASLDAADETPQADAEQDAVAQVVAIRAGRRRRGRRSKSDTTTHSTVAAS